MAGLPSFGHGAFFGIGAYAIRFAATEALAQPVVRPPWALPSSRHSFLEPLVATFISHRRGIYYALLTIAFGQVFWFVSIKWHRVTGGEDGLLNIHRASSRSGSGEFRN